MSGKLDIVVEAGKQGYGLLTNKNGQMILNGDNTIKVTGGADTPYMSGIRIDADSAVAGNAMEFHGNNGDDYLKIMTRNIDNLELALGVK